MKIEINIENENVYRSYWPPHEINFLTLQEDVNVAFGDIYRVMRNGIVDVNSASVKVKHYHEDVGTISVSLE